MTVTAQDILTNARYVLSDIDSKRWSDDRLLLLLNEAIQDISKFTTLFVETIFYTVQNNVVDIDLSPSVTKIVRAEYLDDTLPLFSFEEMDDKDSAWQTVTGTKVEALVYDKQKNGLLKQYPIVENAHNDLITYVGAYGIVTDISYSDIAPILTETYGDISDIPAEGIIKFYYVRKHVKVTDVSTELNIDDSLETMIKHYITGMAFRDNQDTQNRALAKEELGIYSSMIEQYSTEKEQGFVRPEFTVAYKPEGI